MKKTKITKLATLLAIVMFLSMAMPILAAAANFVDFKDLEYKDGKVSGIVVYDDVVTNSVYVNVQDSTYANIQSNVLAGTYTTVTGFVYYAFETSIDSAVYQSVYVEHNGNRSNALTHVSSPPPFWGGGGFFPGTPGVVGDTITAPADGVITEADLRSAFNGRDAIKIVLTGDFALLPIAVLQDISEEKPAAQITVISEDLGTITLPLAKLLYDQLADTSGEDLEDLYLKVQITGVSADTADAIAAAAAQAGGTQVADAVDFELSAVTLDGESFNFNTFGSTYIDRQIALSEEVDADKATGAHFDPATGEFTFRPSTFADDVVTIKSATNSIYTAVAFDKSFNDVPAGHWAAEDISKLANKLVVYGMTEDTFDLTRNVTRAEFAALLVRSLGLRGTDGTATFSDVAAGAWYAPEVAIAAEIGLVYGYEDGTFRPNNQITRQELAALVIRASEFAGFGEELTAEEQAEILGAFTDGGAVSAWASEDVAVAIKNQIVFGMGDNTLAPFASATRAEAAALISRYLGDINFID